MSFKTYNNMPWHCYILGIGSSHYTPGIYVRLGRKRSFPSPRSKLYGGNHNTKALNASWVSGSILCMNTWFAGPLVQSALNPCLISRLLHSKLLNINFRIGIILLQ